MSADLSRQRFNPLKNLSGVLQQQGRVQLDADWNEFVEILDRRFRAETTDIIGRCVVPRETPDGFKITVSGNDLSIGPGRIYVDGLLAENHGDAPAMFDAVLSELRGTNPVLYSRQPYLPSAHIDQLHPKSTGPLLVYIDVWEREVTFIEDPELVEKAVGVDTTARLQTVWQVRVLPNLGNNATCSNYLQPWNDLIAPSAGRLTTAAHGVPSATNPCLIPPTAGYLGLENQLYRVEIHDVNATGQATFKWSRDNASVATNITAVDATGTVLTVDSVGRDSVLCFKAGQWVEITDDVREFDRKPGIMRKVLAVGDKTITLGAALTGADLPNLLQHARVKRWDQAGNVVDTNGGVIPVPAAGTSLLLENGVEVTFSLDPKVSGGKFHVGDYWVFAARTADASVEQLNNAAPRGIHHHYGRLAIVTFPGPTSDCRILWPPEECCDCSVCVTAESHNNGTFTIQQAIDKIKDVGGTICLGPGLYQVTSANPVRIDGAKSIRLKGQSWLTILLSTEVPGVVISNSLRVTVEDLSVATVGQDERSRLAVEIKNSVAVTLQRCAIVQWSAQVIEEHTQETTGAAIGLSGFVIDTRLRDNAIFGANGIAGFTQFLVAGISLEALINLTALLRIDDNFIFASGTGVNFDPSFIHLTENRIAGNFIAGCKSAGIEMRGIVLPGGLLGSRLDIHGNDMSTAGHGIVVGTSQTRITKNDISSSITLNPDQPPSMSLNAGILLAGGGVDSRIEQCQILENRINQMGGFGISLAAQIGSAMIKQNIIDGAGQGGIVMDVAAKASAEVLTIENNQISNIADGFNSERVLLLIGIGVINTEQATIAGNTVIGVGLAAKSGRLMAGIWVVDSISARITGNIVYDIAPVSADTRLVGAGIVVTGAIGRLDVLDNDVNRNRAPASERTDDQMPWISLAINEATTNASIGPSATVETAEGVYIAIGLFYRRRPRGPETIAVRGNILDGYGTSTLILILSRGACLFGDNRCNYMPATDSSNPIASITSEALIVNANFFQTSRNDQRVLLNPSSGQITVLGNIASGPILINSVSMQNTPWAQLNIPTS